MQKKKVNLKWLVIVELMVFYFALLNVISHARGPVPYRIDTSQQVVQTENFMPMVEMGVDATETALPIYNTVEGAVAGYQSELQLEEVNGIYISFSVNCPADYAGKLLYIDLYNHEAGYDFPEQEYQVVLQEGEQEISFSLSPGERAPESCYLRFFTTAQADYILEHVQVNPIVQLPKVTISMIAVVGISLLSLMLTVSYIWSQERKSNCEKGSFA